MRKFLSFSYENFCFGHSSFATWGMGGGGNAQRFSILTPNCLPFDVCKDWKILMLCRRAQSGVKMFLHLLVEYRSCRFKRHRLLGLFCSPNKPIGDRWQRCVHKKNVVVGGVHNLNRSLIREKYSFQRSPWPPAWPLDRSGRRPGAPETAQK